MQSKENKNIIFIRLFPGEDAHNELINVCKKHEIKTAVIISGIGQLKETEIGYFVKKGNYSPEKFTKPLEIICLNGNICKNKDEYISHIHITVSDEDKNAFGGHFIKGLVSVTAEIVLLKTDIEVRREYDDKTGLEALDLS